MKSRSSLPRVLALVGLFLLALGSLSSARADLYVIESTAAGIKVGSRLADSDRLSIPAGAYVRAVLPSGKTQTIKGPYTGPVADFGKGQVRNEGVIAWLRTILQTGGSTEATPGATRGFTREKPKSPPATFSWSQIPVAQGGNVCVQKGSNLQFVRASSAQAEHMTVVDAASSEQAEVQWAGGSTSAAWPKNLTPRADGTYYLMLPNKPRVGLTLRVVEPLPADDDVLKELHRLDCKHQFEAWVREKMSSAKRGT